MTYQLIPDYWSHKKRLDFILKHVNGQANPEILDLACGTGILGAFPLAELGYRVTGVDIDERSITAASKENPFPNLTLVCSDFNAYQPGHQFDVIVAGYVMEHLEHPETLLAAIDRLLTYSGTAIITIPNGYGLHEIEQGIYYRYFEPRNFVPKIRYFNQSLTAIKMRYMLGREWPWPKYNPPLDKLEMTVNLECGHAVRITQKWFEKMVDDAGFEIVDRQPGALLHGQITGHVMCNFRPTIWFNNRIVDFLPFGCAANWFYAIRRKHGA